MAIAERVPFVLATRLANSFAREGICAAIRGAEGGGRVEGLPSCVLKGDDGDDNLKSPTEADIDERFEFELTSLGFLPLCHLRGSDTAVFFSAQTTQRPKKYDRPEATANAAIVARLPYLMVTSRFAHYLKVMARDKIGAFMEPSDLGSWLNRWIKNYVNSNKNSTPTMPWLVLREALVRVDEVPGKPGSYNAVVYIQPWLVFEELTAAMRLVIPIPRNSD